MVNKTNLKKKNQYIILSFFYFIVILGVLLIFKDFGVHIEERFHRMNGLYYLNYIAEIFQLEKIYIITKFKMSLVNDYTLSTVSYYNRHGVIFDVPLALIEIIFDIKNIENVFHTKHLFSFLIFLSSSFFFYKLLIKRFENFFLCFAGTILYITTPRIFGDSFLYKDVLFLSFFTFSLYFFLNLIEKMSLKNLIFFAIFSAITINMRIFGLFIPATFLVILLMKSFHTKKVFFYCKIYLFYLFILIFSLIFFSPYLWSNPFVNFLEIFYSLKKDLINPNIKILFNNQFIFNRNISDYYLITWIFISTPIITIVFFLLGYFSYFARLLQRFFKIKEKTIFNDLWRSRQELQDFIFFFIFTFFFLSLFILNAPFYNGWRLVYFLNIFLIYFMIYCFNNLIMFFRRDKFKKKTILLLLVAAITHNLICLKIYHPYQSVYFSEVITNAKKNSFEGDYYGLSGKDFFLKLSTKNNEKIMKIAVASWIPLHRALDGIDKALRKKFLIVGQNYKNADFIYKSNISEVNTDLNKKYNIPANFDKIYERKINGIKIYEIYKKKNLK